MKALLSIFGRLLRLAGMLLMKTGDRSSCNDVAGYPDVAKLRSAHVDPYRTGNYFAWTKRDE